MTLGQGQPLPIPSAWQLPRTLTQRLPLLPCAVALGRPWARPERQPGTPASACSRQTEGWETNRAKPALVQTRRKQKILGEEPDAEAGWRLRCCESTLSWEGRPQSSSLSPYVTGGETKTQDGEGTTQAAQLVKDTAGLGRDEPVLWSMCEGTCCQCVWGPWFSPPDGTPTAHSALGH